MLPVFSGNFPNFTYTDHSVEMETTVDDEIFTVKEVAVYLKITEKTAYRLAAEGKLPGFKVGGSWRFKRSDLSSWIDSQKKFSGNAGE